ncbi:MAG: amidohydrolase family protein [Kiritimatiellia bacterium]
MKDNVFFNVNGGVGRGVYEHSDFPDMESFIAHLDYLQIDRSLVWHVEARNINPSWGNRKLLAEIDAGGFAERLIPAFVVTPSCYFERGTLDFLKANMSCGRVRALRVMPELSRFPIREIERLLAELAAFKPLVLWDCPVYHDELNIRDYEFLAAKFRKVNFAITQKMWPGFGAVLDLMWRCPNVYVDISWLHMRDTIGLLEEHFGAERILFGIGYRSHYGAAAASLAHAQIKGAHKELIAHGNIERLLGLKPLRNKLSGEPAILAKKPIWKKFVSGLPAGGVKIIDAHGHVGPSTRGWFLRGNDPDKKIPALVRQMDRLGVQKLFISSSEALFGDPVAGNRAAENAAAKYRSRFAGYLAFPPRFGREMAAELDDFFARGFFVGFKLLPAYWKIPLSDPGYRPVWRYAHKHRLPVLIHTWDDKYNSPAMLNDIAPKYPGAFFLLGHSGGGTRGRSEAVVLSQANPNVILEFCGTFTTPVPFEESMRAVGKQQVVFGSDTGAHCEAWELGRFLSMPVPDKDLIQALGANMERILAKAKLGSRK